MAEHLQGWLKALADVGAAVNRGVSLGKLLDLIARTAGKLMSYDFCAITMPDAASQVLMIEGSYGLSADYIREINATHPIRLHGVHTPTPSIQAFTMGVPVQIEDFGSHPAMLVWRAAAKDQGFNSMIAVPLNSAGETLGTLNCYTRSTHHFTKEEESRLLMLADQAALAITTSRLRSQQAERIAVLNGLNESLEEQYELQRQADAIHDRLTALTLEGGGVRALGGALTEILIVPSRCARPTGPSSTTPKVMAYRSRLPFSQTPLTSPARCHVPGQCRVAGRGEPSGYNRDPDLCPRPGNDQGQGHRVDLDERDNLRAQTAGPPGTGKGRGATGFGTP